MSVAEEQTWLSGTGIAVDMPAIASNETANVNEVNFMAG